MGWSAPLTITVQVIICSCLSLEARKRSFFETRTKTNLGTGCTIRWLHIITYGNMHLFGIKHVKHCLMETQYVCATMNNTIWNIIELSAVKNKLIKEY